MLPGKATAGKPVIMHFVTWYPASKEDITGIFIRRHIELLATHPLAKHIIIQKAGNKISVFRHLKSLSGILDKKKQEQTELVQIPAESKLYDKFFWRYKDRIDQAQLNSLIKKYRPSLIHLHVVYGFGKEAVALKEKFQIPFIVSEHMAPFPFEWLHDKEQVIIKPMQQASAVVAVSMAQAKQIEAYTGVKPTVIPNVVDAAEFFYAEKLQQEPGAGLQIVLAGIYDSRKGADYLLSVLPEFIKKKPGTVLHLVGDAAPERMQVLQQLIKSGGLEQSVKFHGRLTATELRKLFLSCHFYVCSSEWESFGVSVLEALFTGLPVLSTNCGGVLEFIDKNNGLLLDNDRKEGTLLNGLLRMAAQVSNFNRAEISKHAVHKFSGEQIIEKYNSIYKKYLA